MEAEVFLLLIDALRNRQIQSAHDTVELRDAHIREGGSSIRKTGNPVVRLNVLELCQRNICGTDARVVDTSCAVEIPLMIISRYAG